MRRTRQSTKKHPESQLKDAKASPKPEPKRRKVLQSKTDRTVAVKSDEDSSEDKSSAEEFALLQSTKARNALVKSDILIAKAKIVSETDDEYKAASSDESESSAAESSQTESEQISSESDVRTGKRKRKKKNMPVARPSRLSLSGCAEMFLPSNINATSINASLRQSENKEIFRKITNADSSSESSSDEFVRVKPSDSLPVDMKPIVPTFAHKEDPFAAIEKNIFSGVTTLSGSESETEHKYTEVNWPSLPGTPQADSILKEDIPTASKKSSRPKSKGKERKVEAQADSKTLDISQLLKLGEGLSSGSMDLAKFEPSEDDLTDLEEVSLDESEKKDETPKYVIPKEGVQITLDIPEVNEKRKKKDFDVQAFLLRRLNNRKRSIQVLIHKVHLLGCISHGRFVNSLLNSEDLMGVSLSLIPSQQCYPPKHADLGYLEKFISWFNKTIVLRDTTCITKYPADLLKSLLNQFDSRTANSKRDLVFMFISVLRSLGIKTRLIISLQPAPLKLASHELCATLPRKAVDSLNYYVDKHKSEKKKSKKSKRSKEEKPHASKHLEKKSSNPRKKNENKSKYFAEKLKKPMKKKETDLKNESVNDGKTSKYFKNIDKNHRSQPRKRPCIGVPDSQQSGEKQEAYEKGLALKTKPNDVTEPKPSSSKSLPKRQARTEVTHALTDDSDSDMEPVVKKLLKREVPKKRFEAKKQLARKPPVKKSSYKKGNTSRTKTISSDSGSDSDFLPETVKSEIDSSDLASSLEEAAESEPEHYIPKKPCKNWSPSDPIDRRVLSSASSDEEPKKVVKKKNKHKGSVSKKTEKKLGVDVWSEVFLEAEEKWFCVDVPQKKVHCSSELHAKATQPVLYVVGFSPDLSIKDVTRRYVVNWTTIKQRVDEVWWEKTLKPFQGKSTVHDREEDEELSDQMLNHPLPTVIGEYKNHPLYVLKRHLLKFEAIYPPDAPTLGFVRSEGVYARENVASLHSREVWVKEAKVVRAGEEPYKIVKARPKYDKATGRSITDIPLHLFGVWQVGEYIPPVAEDGKVPRNEYGNVELFKPCMLPKGTVHLPIAGLSRVAKKLGIDCAPAMIGFDFHSGGSHPTFDGFVVCEEFKDIILDAWTQEVEISAKRAEEKKDKRVYDNWKRLIKGLLIRERLKTRYSFGEEAEQPTSKPSTSKPSTSKPPPSNSRKPVFKKISSMAKRKD